MFCAKCGKELQSGEKFCSQCGAAVGGEKKTVAIETDMLSKGLKNLGASKVAFFTCQVLLLANLFVVCGEMFKISYSVFYSTKYMEFTLFEDKGMLKALYILGYLAAAVMFLLPLITGKEWEKINFFAAICMPLASLMLFFIVLISAVGDMNAEELMEAVDASFTLTTNAWVFLVISLVSLGLTLKVCRDVIFTQDYWRQKEAEERHIPVVPETPRMATPYPHDKIPAWQRVQEQKTAGQEKKE